MDNGFFFNFTLYIAFVQGRQRNPSVNALRSPFSAELRRHYVRGRRWCEKVVGNGNLAESGDWSVITLDSHGKIIISCLNKVFFFEMIFLNIYIFISWL